MEKTFGLIENISDGQWNKMDSILTENRPFDIKILSTDENWAIVKISIAGFNFVNNIAMRIGEQYRFEQYGIKITNFEEPKIETKMFTKKQLTDEITKKFGFSE